MGLPITIMGARSKRIEIPEDALYVNTTSRSKDWGKAFSPFYLGPVQLPNGNKSYNMENAWQYSKVYPDHLDEENNPTDEYFRWAKIGWNTRRAVRYPMGKGAKPKYSYWIGQKLNYIDARKKIYIPLYASLAVKTTAFKVLKNAYDNNIEVYLWDFDGYDFLSDKMTLNDVLHDETRPMGHAFVLAMILTNFEGVKLD